MSGTELAAGAAVPGIIGLVQVARMVGLPSHLAPIVAVCLGILVSVGQIYVAQFPWIPAVVAGVGVGLAAVGLHGGTQALVQASRKASKRPEGGVSSGPVVVPGTSQVAAIRRVRKSPGPRPPASST